MKILYIPLDERPCNYSYQSMFAKLYHEVDLMVLPRELLGDKKIPANTDKIAEWLVKNINDADVFICSLEMLLYGGLLPSRLHQLSVEEICARLMVLEKIKQLKPSIKIMAEMLIMRTPQYDSADEEPEYYENYGKRIFQFGWYSDKKNRVGLTGDEENILQELQKEIPEQLLQDYVGRRKKNCSVAITTLNLVDSGIIDFLVIPQDDSATYGYTAIDQNLIYSAVQERRLQKKVHIYPGADESGSTLMARAINAIKRYQPKIFISYSSLEGPHIIPIYEDRPLEESIKAHIVAAGALSVSSWQEADIILAVNTAGKAVEEAPEQSKRDITYASWRNLREFMQRLEYYTTNNKMVIVADVAFGNGADIELINMLDDYELLDKIYGYAGWNTACNTLGTAICVAVFSYYQNKQVDVNCNFEEAVAFNKIYQMLEAWTYQAKVRGDIAERMLHELGGTYFDVTDCLEKINLLTAEMMLREWNMNIKHSFKKWSIRHLEVNRPWKRMFEIGMNLEICKNNN